MAFSFARFASKLAHQVPPCGIGEMANKGGWHKKKNTAIGVLFFVAPPVGLEPTT